MMRGRNVIKKDGRSRSSDGQIQGAVTASSPAMVNFNDELFLVYTSPNQHIYYTKSRNGIDWGDQICIQPPGGCASTESPALTIFNGKLFMAHKGAGGNNNIYYTSFDGSTWAQEQSIFPGNARMDGTPGLAVLNDRLFLVHKGCGNSHIYYTSTSDGSSWADEQIVAPSGGCATTDSPALCALGDMLVLAHKGAGQNTHIYFTTFDGSSWQPEDFISGAAMRFAPSMTTYGSTLWLAYCGCGSDYYSYLTSATADGNTLDWEGPGQCLYQATWGAPAYAFQDGFVPFGFVAFQLPEEVEPGDIMQGSGELYCCV